MKRPPSIRSTAFSCPYCDVLTTQTWYSLVATVLQSAPASEAFPAWQNPYLDEKSDVYRGQKKLEHVHVTQCFECHMISVWIGDKLVHPQRGKAPPANPDLPEDIRRDYDEASSILDLSPRGAAALLRLAVQKLCKELGQPGKNIDADIGALVKKGLDSRIQKALDSLRVIGGESVHPGQIDLRDDRATAESLFELLNLVVDRLISEPKRIDDIYAKLPQRKRDAIKRRDGENRTPKTTAEDGTDQNKSE